MDPDILKAATTGFRILPSLIVSVETLFGKKTGATKKDAATNLFNAILWGTATGLSTAGSAGAAQAITALQPTVSATIDQLAGLLFPEHA